MMMLIKDCFLPFHQANAIAIIFQLYMDIAWNNIYQI